MTRQKTLYDRKREAFKCKNCGHSTDLHDENGCRVQLLSTGQKCTCTKFKSRVNGESDVEGQKQDEG